MKIEIMKLVGFYRISFSSCISVEMVESFSTFAVFLESVIIHSDGMEKW